MSRNCIVCGKDIRKKTTTYYFKPPQQAREESRDKMVMGGVEREVGYNPPLEEKPDGHREFSGLSWTVYTSRFPKTKAEAQAFVNLPIVSVRRNHHDLIYQITVWDGESYDDEFFHSNTCAMKQGYASARAGHRWKWK